MNFYPLLLQSIHITRQIKLYLISNLPWLFLILLVFISWQVWWNDLFALIKNNLTATQLNGTVLKSLVEQVKHVVSQLILFFPLWLIIWRLSLPVSIRMIEQRPRRSYFSQSYYIFVFDLIKLLVLTLVYTIVKNSIDSNPLWGAITLIIGIFIFSLLYFIQMAFYIEKPHDHINFMINSWFHHLPAVLFLHAIDMITAIISFCVLGLVLAAFTYLPTVLFIILFVLFSFGLGKLWLIRKSLWIYSISSMLKLTSS